MHMESLPLSFIDEPIEVVFDKPPFLEKSPTCPSAFLWRGETYPVVEMLGTWQDFRRRGRFARNMIPEHAATASRRGSWDCEWTSRRVVSLPRTLDTWQAARIW